MRKNAADSDLLTTANEQAQRLIQELLAPVTQDSDKNTPLYLVNRLQAKKA